MDVSGSFSFNTRYFDRLTIMVKDCTTVSPPNNVNVRFLNVNVTGKILYFSPKGIEDIFVGFTALHVFQEYFLLGQSRINFYTTQQLTER